MKIPEPYFSNVPEIGDLVYLYTFYELERPILFVCRDKKNKLYICSCCELYPQLTWVIANIKAETLISLIHNKCAIAEVFKKGSPKYIIQWNAKSKNENDTKVESFEQSMLPDNDEFLDAEEAEFADLEAYLRLIKISQVNKEKNAYQFGMESGLSYTGQEYQFNDKVIMVKKQIYYTVNGEPCQNKRLNLEYHFNDEDSLSLNGVNSVA